MPAATRPSTRLSTSDLGGSSLGSWLCIAGPKAGAIVAEGSMGFYLRVPYGSEQEGV